MCRWIQSYIEHKDIHTSGICCCWPNRFPKDIGGGNAILELSSIHPSIPHILLLSDKSDSTECRANSIRPPLSKMKIFGKFVFICILPITKICVHGCKRDNMFSLNRMNTLDCKLNKLLCLRLGTIQGKNQKDKSSDIAHQLTRDQIGILCN